MRKEKDLTNEYCWAWACLFCILQAEKKHKNFQESDRFMHYYTRFKNHEHSYQVKKNLQRSAWFDIISNSCWLNAMKSGSQCSLVWPKNTLTGRNYNHPPFFFTCCLCIIWSVNRHLAVSKQTFGSLWTHISCDMIILMVFIYTIFYYSWKNACLRRPKTRWNSLAKFWVEVRCKTSSIKWMLINYF